ncbi:MAG: hypothetical protein V4732_22080 [Pseudomonadota bacterium]
MIIFTRHPYVRDLIFHYANSLEDSRVLNILENGVTTEDEAIKFANFIWQMIDQMAIDCENNTQVLGRTDNSDMMPDLDYEVSLYLSNQGFDDIWDKSCDEN